MYLLNEIGQNVHIQSHRRYIEVKKIQLCLKLTFLEIPHKSFGVCRRVIIECLGVQMTSIDNIIFNYCYILYM